MLYNKNSNKVKSLAKCLHCELEIITNNKDFNSEKFCCFGCESAYQIINETGLNNYYKIRTTNTDLGKTKPKNYEQIDLSEFAKQDENKINSLFLAIDGMHCAACVWLIENILKKQQNIVLARVNLTKKYLLLKWRGDKKDANNYIDLIQKIGYNLFPFDEKILQEEERKYNNELLKCLAVAGFGSGNVMLFSSILWFSDLNKIGQATIDLMHFASAIIALPVIVYAAKPFFSSAFKALRAKNLNMDLSISVAIFLACLVSLVESFNSAKHVYFDSAVMLIFFLLIGRYLDFKARKKAFAIAAEFSLLTANYARIITDEGLVKIIASKDIKKGMTLLVVAGDKIPADGLIIDGESEIDTAIITGETLPRLFKKDQEIFAGMVNLLSPLKIKVNKDPENSLLKRIINIVEEVEGQKNRFIRLADKLAKFYTPIVHLLAFATFALWYFFLSTGFENALLNATAVLIITCPCALALAVPIVQTITISGFIKKGILVKSSEALEKTDEIAVIIFDKTGTLTIGNPQLIAIKGLNKNLDEKDKKFYLKIAASMAQMSKHPISQALSKSYSEEKFSMNIIENQGFGLLTNFNNITIKIGRKDFCDIKSPIPDNKENLQCFLKYGDDEILFLFQDQLKEDAKRVIARLKSMNKEIILLSGDMKNIVERTAKDLTINEFYFEQTPVAKAELLQKIKMTGKKIMMIGDGLNDAPSLALADISISFAKASDITQSISDIVIQKNNLAPIVDLFNFNHKSIMLIKQNLLLALVYNAIAVPFAIAGNVTPLIAAIAMSSSSILVLLNSLRILR